MGVNVYMSVNEAIHVGMEVGAGVGIGVNVYMSVNEAIHVGMEVDTGVGIV